MQHIFAYNGLLCEATALLLTSPLKVNQLFDFWANHNTYFHRNPLITFAAILHATDRQTDRQTDSRNDKQNDRQTDLIA